MCLFAQCFVLVLLSACTSQYDSLVSFVCVVVGADKSILSAAAAGQLHVNVWGPNDTCHYGANQHGASMPMRRSPFIARVCSV